MRAPGWLVLIGLSVPVAHADSLIGFCASPLAPCTSDGHAVVVDSSLPTFGFSYKSTKLTSRPGTDFLAFLVPDNQISDPTDISFDVRTNNGGLNDATTVVAATSLFPKKWHYGYLGAFIGGDGLPNQLFQEYSASGNPDVAAVNPDVTGYWIYLVNLGWTTMTETGPTYSLENLEGISGLPNGTFIVDFLNVFNPKGYNDGRVATENTSALFIDHVPSADPVNPAPEPGAIVLFGTGLLGAAVLAKKRRSAE